MSQRITPTKATVLIRVFELDGWTVQRQKGSHISMTKPGHARPVVIPKHDGQDVAVRVIKSNLRTAKMSRERFLELLAQV